MNSSHVLSSNFSHTIELVLHALIISAITSSSVHGTLLRTDHVINSLFRPYASSSDADGGYGRVNTNCGQTWDNGPGPSLGQRARAEPGTRLSGPRVNAASDA